MSGSGTLVTSAGMSDSSPLDPEGYVVSNLTGPSLQIAPIETAVL